MWFHISAVLPFIQWEDVSVNFQHFVFFCLPATWFLMDLVQRDSRGSWAAASARTRMTPTVWASVPNRREDGKDTHRYMNTDITHTQRAGTEKNELTFSHQLFLLRGQDSVVKRMSDRQLKRHRAALWEKRSRHTLKHQTWERHTHSSNSSSSGSKIPTVELVVRLAALTCTACM